MKYRHYPPYTEPFWAAGRVWFLVHREAGRTPGRQAYDAAALVLFPERVRLDVLPGNTRVKAGNPLAIEASLAGNRAPVTPRVQIQGR